MIKKNILVVANRGTNNKDLLAWYESAAAFDLQIAASDEEAIELAHQQLFDLVLADSTDDNIDVKKLEAILPILNRDILVVEYKGEPFQTINEKISAAFDSRKARRIRKLMVLETSEPGSWYGVPKFSEN